MTKRHLRIVIIAAVLIVVAVAVMTLGNMHHYDIADKAVLKDYVKKLETEIPDFKTAEDVKNSVVNWATGEGLEYKEDKYGNLIFKHKASGGNSDVDPTVVCIPYDEYSIENNKYAIAMGEYLALHGINSTDANIIFVNNSNNNHIGAEKISKKYFPKGANVIYLDSIANSAYLSRHSFGEVINEISVPYSEAPRRCDTMLNITIGGISPTEPGYASNLPNPITTLNTILSRLKNKAIDFQIASIEVINDGNLSPRGINISILINSYSIDSMSKYLTKKSEDYVDDYSKDSPDLFFTFDVITDADKLPDTAYSDDTTNHLYNLIYTVKNGRYKFKEDEAPHGYKEGQVYGINCYEDIKVSNDKLSLVVSSSALNKLYLEDIVNDNKAAASLSEATIKEKNYVPVFNNPSKDLIDRLNFSYIKVNDTTSKDADIKLKDDRLSTLCSYLQDKNKNLDIVHLSASKSSYYKLLNAIMNVTTYDRNLFDKIQQ